MSCPKIRKLEESIPDWIDELGEKFLGENVGQRSWMPLNNKAEVI